MVAQRTTISVAHVRCDGRGLHDGPPRDASTILHPRAQVSPRLQESAQRLRGCSIHTPLEHCIGLTTVFVGMFVAHHPTGGASVPAVATFIGLHGCYRSRTTSRGHWRISSHAPPPSHVQLRPAFNCWTVAGTFRAQQNVYEYVHN